ncbi:MAG TPA: hypothetical protein VN625_03410, partial [Desulfuromonadaceae bacterium]|nr:hypothetical protein [Desulfuromonadaceae bacterium]
LKAADLILRDGNLPLVLLDLALNPEAGRIPSTTWYRFQRLIEETGSLCVVFTSQPMITCARVRVTLKSQFSLEALDTDEWLRRIQFIVSHAHSPGEMQETLQNTA